MSAGWSARCAADSPIVALKWQNAPPRKVVGFPTRDDLERFAYIWRNRKPLTQEFINTSIAGRDYQIRAIRSVLEGIEQKKRNFLLVMATGTGKTRTCIALIDALMRAGHAEKVLFLVDRIALREQALGAFKEHMPNEPRWPNLGEKLIAKDRRIYVATYPTMLNIIRDEVQHLSPHFFDFIVVDESHRSIYNTYGGRTVRSADFNAFTVCRSAHASNSQRGVIHSRFLCTFWQRNPDFVRQLRAICCLTPTEAPASSSHWR